MTHPQSDKIQFRNDDGIELAGRFERPAGEARATAIFAHCFTCSKDIAAASRISRALARRGVAVLRFDFTGLGNSDGDFANTDFSSNVADLVAAARHLREAGCAPSLLIGHSLGGAAVVMAAGEIEEVSAVVTIGTPSEPRHVERLLVDDREVIQREGRARVRLGGREFTIRREFLEDLERHDLATRLRTLDKALMVMHSPVDAVVGIDNARRMYEAARHPKSFIAIDKADHLLSAREDSEFVAEVIAAWSARYVDELPEVTDERPQLASGEVLVRERGEGYTNDVYSAAHHWTADEPRPASADLGPNPYEHLLAALGACTSMTLRMYSDRKDWPLERVSVKLAHDRIHAEDCAECESESGRIDRILIELKIEGALDESQRARLLEIADRCPVHRTLRNEKRIETRLSSDA